MVGTLSRGQCGATANQVVLSNNGKLDNTTTNVRKKEIGLSDIAKEIKNLQEVQTSKLITHILNKFEKKVNRKELKDICGQIDDRYRNVKSKNTHHSKTIVSKKTSSGDVKISRYHSKQEVKKVVTKMMAAPTLQRRPKVTPGRRPVIQYLPAYEEVSVPLVPPMPPNMIKVTNAERAVVLSNNVIISRDQVEIVVPSPPLSDISNSFYPWDQNESPVAALSPPMKDNTIHEDCNSLPTSDQESHLVVSHTEKHTKKVATYVQITEDRISTSSDSTDSPSPHRKFKVNPTENATTDDINSISGTFKQLPASKTTKRVVKENFVQRRINQWNKVHEKASCRLCGMEKEARFFQSLFSAKAKENDLISKVVRSCGIDIKENDPLSKFVCRMCEKFVMKMTDFRKICQRTQLRYSLKRSVMNAPRLTLPPPTVPSKESKRNVECKEMTLKSKRTKQRLLIAGESPDQTNINVISMLDVKIEPESVFSMCHESFVSQAITTEQREKLTTAVNSDKPSEIASLIIDEFPSISYSIKKRILTDMKNSCQSLSTHESSSGLSDCYNDTSEFNSEMIYTEIRSIIPFFIDILNCLAGKETDFNLTGNDLKIKYSLIYAILMEVRWQKANLVSRIIASLFSKGDCDVERQHDFEPTDDACLAKSDITRQVVGGRFRDFRNTRLLRSIINKRVIEILKCQLREETHIQDYHLFSSYQPENNVSFLRISNSNPRADVRLLPGNTPSRNDESDNEESYSKEVVRQVAPGILPKHNLIAGVIQEYVPLTSSNEVATLLEKMDMPNTESRETSPLNLVDNITSNRSSPIKEHILNILLPEHEIISNPPEPPCEVISIQLETIREIPSILPESNQEVLAIQPEPNNEILSIQPEPNHEVLTIQPEANHEVLSIQPETNNEILTIQPEANHEVLPIQPESNHEILSSLKSEPAIGHTYADVVSKDSIKGMQIVRAEDQLMNINLEGKTALLSQASLDHGHSSALKTITEFKKTSFLKQYNLMYDGRSTSKASNTIPIFRIQNCEEYSLNMAVNSEVASSYSNGNKVNMCIEENTSSYNVVRHSIGNTMDNIVNGSTPICMSHTNNIDDVKIFFVNTEVTITTLEDDGRGNEWTVHRKKATTSKVCDTMEYLDRKLEYETPNQYEPLYLDESERRTSREEDCVAKHPSGDLVIQNKSKNQNNKKTPNEKECVYIVGDCTLKGIRGIDLKKSLNTIDSVFVRCFPGATSTDMMVNCQSVMEKKPSYVILHCGTNDLPTGAGAKEISVKIIQLASQLKRVCGDVMVSGIIPRRDRWDVKRQTVNMELRNKCSLLNIAYKEHHNIDKEKDLEKGGVNLNKDGSSRLYQNLIEILNSRRGKSGKINVSYPEKRVTQNCRNK